MCFPYGDDEKEIEHTSDEAGKQADRHALGNNLGMHLTLSFKYRLSTLQMGGSCKQYKFPDDAYMYCGRISAHGAKSYKVYWAMVQNSEGSVHAWAMAPEDNWDDVEEDFYKMLGSMQAE